MCLSAFVDVLLVCVRDRKREKNCVRVRGKERERETMYVYMYTYLKCIHILHTPRTHAIQNMFCKAACMCAPLAPHLKVDERCGEVTLWIPRALVCDSCVCVLVRVCVSHLQNFSEAQV
jgi:hypothetical protein